MGDFYCLLTNQKIAQQDIHFSRSGGFQHSYYLIQVGNKEFPISICGTLRSLLLSRSDKEFFKEFEKIRPILLFEWLNNNLNELGGDLMHWNCQNAIGKEHQLVLKPLIPKLLKDPKYPKTRKQKSLFLMKFLKEGQGQEGGIVTINNRIEFWGKLFFANFKELIFYIEQLVDEGFVKYNDTQHTVQLTFKGLDHLEEFTSIKVLHEPNPATLQFDIGLSFAGEDRKFVDEVAQELKKNGVTIFYDDDAKAFLWGKDLFQTLSDVYKNKCKFCIIFISENYANKLWAKHELKAAQAKAFTENKEYILPVKFDDTDLPGMHSTVGYLDATETPPKEIARLAIEKLQSII